MATEELSQSPAEEDESSAAGLIRKAEELKEKGNALFKAKEYKKAITRYTWQPDGEAATYAGDRSRSSQYTDDERRAMVRLEQTANGNIAQCYLSLGEYRKCRDYCAKVIGKNTADAAAHPNQDLLVKALTRSAQASLRANDLDSCKAALLKALELDPKSGPARATYKQLQDKYKAHNAEQRKQMTAAFQAA